ncbi:MAG: hypothetical protein ACPG6B_02960 [Oceanihabitans sp.]
MTEKHITIKEVSLNNNCPECYNTKGLQLTFKQKFIETSLYRSITNETTHEIHCNTCNTTIYPVMWTDDIERVFTYQQKAFVAKKTSTKLKKKAWFLVLAITLLIVNAILITVYYK